MTNPHIIVDQLTKRCLCGIYNDTSKSCQDILDAVRYIVSVAPNTSPEFRKDADLINRSISTLIEDREQ